MRAAASSHALSVPCPKKTPARSRRLAPRSMRARTVELAVERFAAAPRCAPAAAFPAPARDFDRRAGAVRGATARADLERLPLCDTSLMSKSTWLLIVLALVA